MFVYFFCNSDNTKCCGAVLLSALIQWSGVPALILLMKEPGILQNSKPEVTTKTIKSRILMKRTDKA